MANYRQIRITDADNTANIALNDFDGYLATFPTGLGIYMTNSYLNVGSKRIKTNQENSYKEITMIVDIYATKREDIEKKYNALRNFLVRYRDKGFRLYYSASDEQERYILCDIRTADKSEKSKSRFMSLPLIIDVRSYWKTDIQSSSTAQDEQTGNLFQFAEDEDYETGNIVNVAKTIVGSGNLSETITTLPEQINFDVTIDTYNVSFKNTDFKETSSGVLTAKKQYRSTSRLVYSASIGFVVYITRYMVECVINMNNGSVTFSAYVGTSIRSTISQCDVSIGANTIHISRSEENAQTNEETLYIQVYPNQSTIDKGGSSKYIIETLGLGETERTIVLSLEDGEPYLIKGHVVTEENNEPVETPYWVNDATIRSERFNYTFTADTVTMYITGDIYYGGQDEHVVGLLEDEDTNEYNVAFFFGSVIENNISNEGDTEIPLLIRVFGACANPIVKLLDENGNTIQSSKVITTVPAKSYIEINSDPENAGVWLVYQTTGQRINMMDNVDQTTNVFITLPRGRYKIAVTDIDNSSVPTTVYFANEYVGA